MASYGNLTWNILQKSRPLDWINGHSIEFRYIAVCGVISRKKSKLILILYSFFSAVENKRAESDKVLARLLINWWLLPQILNKYISITNEYEKCFLINWGKKFQFSSNRIRNSSIFVHLPYSVEKHEIRHQKSRSIKINLLVLPTINFPFVRNEF